MEYIQILEMLGTAIAASWLTRILTIKARVRQEKYYVLHPDVVTELEGLFALEFAEWSCGME